MTGIVGFEMECVGEGQNFTRTNKTIKDPTMRGSEENRS